MLKRISVLALTVMMGMMLLASPASAQTVTVENNTGAKLTKLFISNAETNSWDDNALTGKTLAPGESFDLTFNGKFTMYDLLAVFDDGQQKPYYGINVRQFTFIRLNPDGVETHK